LIGAVRYECGPTDTLSGGLTDADICDNNWFGIWNGYFNVPTGEAGDYEFMVQFQPQLSINFDVNGDGSFADESTCWPFDSIRAGDRFFYMNTLDCSTEFRHKVLRKFAGLGTDAFPNAPLQGKYGGTHWGHCYNNTDADPTGADFFNFDNAYTPPYPSYPDFTSSGYTVYGYTVNWTGTSECPVAMNISHSLSTGNETANRNGETWVSFTRNLGEGLHRMKVNFNSKSGRGSSVHHLHMWYRRPPASYQWDWPRSGDWIDLSTLILGDTCPFSPTLPTDLPVHNLWSGLSRYAYPRVTPRARMHLPVPRTLPIRSHSLLRFCPARSR